MTTTYKKPVVSQLRINLQGDNDEDGTEWPSPLWINPRVDGRNLNRNSLDPTSWMKPNWLDEQGKFMYSRTDSPGYESSEGDDSSTDSETETQPKLSFSTILNVKKAASIFRSKSTLQTNTPKYASLQLNRSKTSIGTETFGNSFNSSKNVRWMDETRDLGSRRGSFDYFGNKTMISRSKSFSVNEPLSGLFDLSKAAGKRKSILVPKPVILSEPPPRRQNTGTVLLSRKKHRRQRLCKIKEAEEHTVKIGDRKVSDDELDTIVSRLGRPTNSSRARSALAKRVFFPEPEKKRESAPRVNYLVFEPTRFRGLRKVNSNQLEEITERLNTYDIERWPPNSARDELRQAVIAEKLGVLNSIRLKGVKNC